MGVYGKAIITTAGRNLIAQALAGNESVRFTELKTSDYKYASTASLDALTDIPNVKQTTDITSALVTANSNVKVSAMVRNSGLTAAYYINTIGIYGNTPGFADTLIAVIPATTGDLVPAYSGSPYSFVFDVNLIIQNASNLNVSVNDAGVATVADLNALWEKAYDVYITNDVSGDVVTFQDGADMIPMKSVSVNFSPVQSFNGYSKPWGPGMGKNICSQLVVGKYFNPSTGVPATSSTSASTEKIAVENLNSGITLSYTIGFRAMMFAWDQDGNFIGRTTGSVYAPSNAFAKTDFSSGSGNKDYNNIKYIALRFYTADGTPTDISEILSDQVMLELGTTATAYEPYENICPINSHSTSTVTRCGLNLLENNATVSRSSAITIEKNSDGSIIINGETSRNEIPIYNFKTNASLNNQNNGEKTIPNGTWYVSTGNESANIRLQIIGSNSPQGTSGVAVIGNTNAGNITINDSYKYNWVRLILGADTYEDEIVYPMICPVSESDSAYIPYDGAKYTNNLPTKFFGGTVDFVSGLVSSEWAEISSYSGETLPGEWLSSYDVYAPGTTPTNGAQVVYKRSTPVVTQVEPKDIYSVYGINTVWSDQNNIDVAYRADTKLYIDAKIAETQALALENS